MTGQPPLPTAEPTLLPEGGPEGGSEGRNSSAARMRSALRPALRPVLTALARVIATDRRAVVLANRKAEILLANAAASRLGLSRATLTARLDWAGLCAQTDRAGSAALSWQHEAQHFDGELVLVPLGGTQGAALQGYLLRLAESDQESTWLRNRARAAALMRVAHDLRTPIQSLLASADTLIRSTGSAAERAPELATELAGMRRAAALSLDHIGNVLAVIRGESAGGGSQPDEDFRIGDELANLVAMVAPLARAHATEVSLAIDAPEGLTLHGPLRFVRALSQNLIDNSVNHGGGRVAVTLRCAPLDAEQPPDQASDQPPDQAGPEAAGQMGRQTGRQMGNHGAGSPRRGAAGRPWRITLEIRDEGGGLSDTAKARLSEALGTAATEPTAGITAGTAAGVTGGQPTGGTGGETGRGAGGTAIDATLAASAGATRPSAGMNVLAHALRQLGGQMVIQDLGRDGQPMRPPLKATPMKAPTGLGRNPGPKIGTETGPAAPQPQSQAPQRTGRVIGTLFEVSFSLPRAPELPQPEAQSQDLAQNLAQDLPPHNGANLPPHQRGNSALPAGTAEGKTRAGLSGRHILLVEDSPSSRDWLAHLLRSHGAEITAAGSGPEALALMSRAGLTRPVDLILSDVTLPRMSGIELTALLRAGNGAAAQAWTGPIVGLTAHADDRIRAACLEAGMNKILEKPVQPATLCAILAAILQGNALAAAAGRALPPLPDPKTTAPISAQTLADMTEHMGAAPALAFITRAMEEAQIVHDELQQEGPGPDTGRRIHAATGAAGLTGLVEIERQLRALEQAAETASPALPTILGALELALLQARSFAESLQT